MEGPDLIRSSKDLRAGTPSTSGWSGRANELESEAELEWQEVRQVRVTYSNGQARPPRMCSTDSRLLDVVGVIYDGDLGGGKIGCVDHTT